MPAATQPKSTKGKALSEIDPNALKKDGVTKAGLARAIGEKTADRMSRFLEKKKVMSQNTNPVYYNSYVLFEKMRIRDGQEKSKFRLKMEEVHGAKGADTKVNFDGSFWMHESEAMHIDEYGVLKFRKRYLVERYGLRFPVPSFRVVNLILRLSYKLVHQHNSHLQFNHSLDPIPNSERRPKQSTMKENQSSSTSAVWWDFFFKGP